jgi:large subunit ribosomal protein L52
VLIKQLYFFFRKKLPLNPMDRGVLTDGADYVFLDGRPTPFGTKQKRKLLLQREYAVSYFNVNIN